MHSVEGKIINKNTIKDGTIIFNEKIEDLIFEKNLNYKQFVIPGFIDLHCHGGNGHDTMQGLQSIIKLSQYHLSNGTTTLFPTTVTDTKKNISFALNGLNNYLSSNEKQSNIEGVHLEGPFINPNKLGAQPPFAQSPDLEFVRNLQKQAPIKIITIAPEIEGGLEFISKMIEIKIKPQIGHTLADLELCNFSIKKGAQSFTHLFNAMSGFNHRNPGAVASALSNLNYSEIICDLIHVHPEMIKLAYKNIKNLYAITDCVSASGLEDGQYDLGFHKVYKENNIVKLNNNLAGSILTMHQAFKNLVKIGFSMVEAVQMTSTNASKYLNKKDIGNLNVGSQANLLVLDKDLNIFKVFLHGKEVKIHL